MRRQPWGHASVAPAGHRRPEGCGHVHGGALGYVCFFVGCYVAFCLVDETPVSP